MTIHLTNIGGQVLPVLQGLMEFPCDKAILLHSKESLAEALKVKSFIKVPSELILLEDPNNFSSVTTVLHTLLENNPKAVWNVNISSGTKIMSVALYSAFTKTVATCKLFHLEQNGWVHLLLPELKSEKIKAFLPVKSYFEFAGYHIKSASDYNTLSSHVFDVQKQVKELYSGANKEELSSLLNEYRKKKYLNTHSSFYIQTVKGSKLFWSSKEVKLTLDFTSGKTVVFESASAYGMLLETKWFELEVAALLNHWKQNIEMLWEVIVATNQGDDKNEIDLIVNTGNKLLFVECKTSVADVKDIDKFQNVTSIYGGFGAKAILITYLPLTKPVLERCTFNKILHFSLLNHKKQKNNTQSLLKMLDAEIIKTNK